ncbi:MULTISPECIES: DNA polymerase III subunit delta' [unclassified Campylobacter]|uniref:DNA polymerase III subunit delta' n=1 Tax=unclassified Campylobacter TaxID=2593542 RepID=UPI0012382259|nr:MULTISPECIES: DNA polymerase III subunit delta' [unclassified Campylobacter]KAA6226365.1 DNA polymerase III subunit delta' [Campylobacter sp. LR286c]KAA6226597.1 DNA polymerase III subunit delta' [Campylobacter sp. LR185c]KAA6226857.1 DNA polymerase III subunit delta' [Campylobacter sp. LR196d]KAA6230294.1 DNA polymerase III subunit delta' [Campylobacter sp. LR291e]KAA6233815.1 DNA polymerase III subunit delta' [Campylobacter sp. LR264d]
MFISKILISEDFDNIKADMIKKYGLNNLRFIPNLVAPNFLIEHARAVEKESYIAEKDEKIIVLMAQHYEVEAQNSLLKLFEEPPKNIKFLLVVPSKNLLLPTIKSRLICEKVRVQKEERNLNLDLKKLDLKAIYDFLEKNERLEKNVFLEKIVLLCKECLKITDFNEEELEFFYESYELAKLNSKSGVIFATLLLNFYLKDRK